MPELQATMSSLEGVDESIAEFYTAQEDGTFLLNVVGNNGFELENTTALKSALGKERSNAQQASKALKAYEGLDPEEARTAMNKLAEYADFDPEKKVEEAMKARETQLLKKHETVLSSLQDEKTILMQQLEQNLVTSAATKAIAENEGAVDLLLPHVLQQTRMRMTDNGSFIAEVVDREGSPRIGDSQGNPMTIPQLVEEMKSSDAFARAFNSSGATGSGATNNAAPKGGTGRGRSISRHDQEALNANIEALASGEITISD
jgi:hypothetical protein